MFYNNKNPIICIADIVINKISCIKDVLILALKENKNDALSKDLNLASKNIDDLIDWVKYLKITHDLQDLNYMYDESDRMQERRKENRYLLPEIYQKHLNMKVKLSDAFVPVSLIDYSTNGIKFRSQFSFDIDSIKEGIVSLSETDSKIILFKVKIRHCKEHNGMFITGGQIEEIADDISIELFKKIHSYIMGIVVRKR